MFTARVRFSRRLKDARFTEPTGDDASSAGEAMRTVVEDQFAALEQSIQQALQDECPETPGPRRAEETSADRKHAEGQWRQIEQTLAAVVEEVREIERRRQQSLHELRQVAVELAIAIASRILHERIGKDEYPVEQLIDNALNQLDFESPLSVALHPKDLELLACRMKGKPPPWAQHSELRLVPDSTLTRGSCRIEGPKHEVLTDSNVLLTEIRQFLLDHLADARTERR
jgi:flagellar biosynthesis/type III secretory pathway protein FliH